MEGKGRSMQTALEKEAGSWGGTLGDRKKAATLYMAVWKIAVLLQVPG